VLEESLKNADDELLANMFNEILEGYVKDARGRDALDIMLFDQFGNYVVQRLLDIASAVFLGKRRGDKKWLMDIARKVIGCQRSLNRYSSGKKILEKIDDVFKQARMQSMMPTMQQQPNPQMFWMGAKPKIEERLP